MKKEVYLTGDRATGKLHIGHFVGSLKQRLELQDKPNLEQFIFIADAQALTDNAFNPQKIRDSLIHVCYDYLSIGLDPNKNTIFVQSQINALSELFMYYLNFVTKARLERNPTIKDEIKQHGYKNDIPAGFLTYPVSQAADITAFNANFVPVGDDQIPVIEQAREIVHSFNSFYGETLVMPKGILPKDEGSARLVGIDGNGKMSKSLNNGIYLSDDDNTIKNKIMSMFTDPNHIKVSDPGKVEGNVVFSYLDVFANEEMFNQYLPEFKNINELKEKYRKGGLGDIKIKTFLYNILSSILTPINEKRKSIPLSFIFEVLEDGNKKANKVANETLNRVKDKMGLNYFEEFKKNGSLSKKVL